MPNAKGVIIPSEGRLKSDIKARSGVKFVEKSEEWEIGTCLEMHTHIFEKAIDIIRKFVTNNPQNYRYVFIIDSIDALIPRADAEKVDEAIKVAGGALLSSDFLRRMALAISINKHLVILISQVRSKIKINQYEPSEYQLTNASGGHALLHYSDWIFEFQGRYQGDVIWSGEKGKSDRLGHRCKIIFKKSPNEKSGFLVEYPIRYGRKGGQSVWVEYEIIDKLTAFDQVVRKGAWMSFNDAFHEDISKELKTEIPKQFNGETKFREYLEENPKVTKYLFRKIKDRLT